MRVISKAAIRQFSKRYPSSLEPLLRWYQIAKRAEWRSTADLKADFGHADFVGKYTIFNIAGNKYRLIAIVKYEWQIVYVRNVLTHAEYDKGDWKR